MRLLLPPSETKADDGDGPPLDLDRLGFPELTHVRQTLLAALGELAADPERCRATLGLSVRQDAQILRNAELLTSPTLPAITRYTGVLYDALDASRLSTAARRRAATTVVLCSALFGALRPDDLIPAYRLSAGNILAVLGAPAAVWRPWLVQTLTQDGPVIDLRSGAYTALAPVPGAIAVRVIGADGRSASHTNKSVKGQLVRAFLTAPRQPRTVRALITAATAAGLTVRLADRRTLELVSC